MLELNETNFDESINQGLVLVDFNAQWCGPCRMLAPMLAALEDVTVTGVDIDESPDLAARYSVSSIPLMVFFKDGVEVARVLGLRSKEYLQEQVDALNNESSV